MDSSQKPAMKARPGAQHLLLLALAPCLCLVLAPRLPQPADGARCSPPRSGQPGKELIQRAYDRLAYYTSTSGAPLAFELSDFERIDRERFDEIAYLDVADLHQGARIRVEPVTHARQVERPEQEPEVADLERAYFARWEEAPPDPRAEVMAAKTLQDVFALSASAEPGLRNAAAVTAYRVSARLDDKSRGYQALFVWLSAPDPSGSCFIVLDEVTDQVAQAFREKAPLAKSPGRWHRPARPASP